MHNLFYSTCHGKLIRCRALAPDLAIFMSTYADAFKNGDFHAAVEMFTGPQNPLAGDGKALIHCADKRDQLFLVQLDMLLRCKQGSPVHWGDTRWYTIPEAARFLQCSKEHITDALSRGELIAERTGRHCILSEDALSSYDQSFNAFRIRYGRVPGAFIFFKIADFKIYRDEYRDKTCVVRTFKRAAIRYKDVALNARVTCVLEPDDCYREIISGPFYLRGRFDVTERADDDSGKALYREFRPE